MNYVVGKLYCVNRNQNAIRKATATLFRLHPHRIFILLSAKPVVPDLNLTTLTLLDGDKIHKITLSNDSNWLEGPL